eukprot:TRINITY_DN3682_c0_g1_i1.p1 TRINITY_DN3682_c0_g1~~TRINITY_DN3682_c0_g1_i1.p1  ORF type:complete len:400 (-),score=86.19 TRINITY_DN3682_c0_g1_i1:251-1450(-)
MKDVEKQPLLQKEEDNSMSYDARKLVTFDVFTNLGGTVWKKRSLWSHMGMLGVTSIMTCVLACILVGDPASIDAGRFAKISQFLNVIVGLLLGFFLSTSVTRWYAATTGFLKVFDAVRSLQMQLTALGAPQDRVRTVLRYGVVSAYCLSNDLYRAALPEGVQADFKEAKWQDLTAEGDTFDDAWDTPGKSLGKVTLKERVTLQKVQDPAQTLWVWVTSLLTRMSSDGELPPLPSPVYGRIIAMAETAHDGIREVRSSISVQPPYIYVQVLAMLVGANNIIAAASFGLSLGVVVDFIFAHFQLLGIHVDIKPESESRGLQDLVIVCIMSTIGPFLYQALLEVAVCISQPFAVLDGSAAPDAPGSIPIAKLILGMQQDLRDAEMMIKVLPCWEQPRFKKPA